MNRPLGRDEIVARLQENLDPATSEGFDLAGHYADVARIIAAGRKRHAQRRRFDRVRRGLASVMGAANLRA